MTKIYGQVGVPMRLHETDGIPIYCLCDIRAVLTSHQVSMLASNEYNEGSAAYLMPSSGKIINTLQD